MINLENFDQVKGYPILDRYGISYNESSLHPGMQDYWHFALRVNINLIIRIKKAETRTQIR